MHKNTRLVSWATSASLPISFSLGRATPSSPRPPISWQRVKTRSKTPLFGHLAKEGAVLQSKNYETYLKIKHRQTLYQEQKL